MKRLLFLFLFFLTATAPGLRAQGYTAPDVTVSVEKANIAGKVYYIHKVLPKQTLFSICKAYGVTQDELRAANPDLKEGLKAGAIIFVPYKEGAATAQGAAPAAAQEPGPGREETAETDDPESGDAPQAVQRVVEYRVRWFDTLRYISRKFNVSPEELLDYNGLTSANEIHGRVLLIPYLDGAEAAHDPDDSLTVEPDDEPVAPVPAAKSAPGTAEMPEPPMTPVRKARHFTADDPMRIALVLPLDASGKASEQFLQFYAGALLAVYQQKEQGAHLVLNVYDLAQGAPAILEDRKFSGSDLIIGPVEARTLAPFLAFSDRNGTPLVSPLDHKVDSLVGDHAFLFQVPPSPEVQTSNLVASLRARSQDRVILVTNDTAPDNAFLTRLEASLQARDIAVRKTGLADLAGLLPSGSRLSPTKVILGSEDRAFAAEAIRTLNALARKGIPLEVWGTNRVRNYETSDPDALYNISLHTPAPYYVDYSDPRDQQFVRQFRALYYAEPDDFAFQGYDVLTYFITVLMQQGTGFFLHPEDYPMQLLHCNFHFVRDHTESGWRNRATRNLVYDRDSFAISVSK